MKISPVKPFNIDITWLFLSEIAMLSSLYNLHGVCAIRTSRALIVPTIIYRILGLS